MAELQVNYNGWSGYSWEGYYVLGYTTFYDPIANTTTVTLSESVRHRYYGVYNYYTTATLDITVTADDSGDSGTASGSYENTTNGGMDNYYSRPNPRVITVQHGSTAGVKSVTISASSRLQVYLVTSDYSVTYGSGSVSVPVGEYYPASGLIVPNGTLGVSQTLTVDRIVDTFTHTITYACGTASGTICTKSSKTSINWTPPISLASQNTKGTSVAVQFAITTYTGNTLLGTKTVSVAYAIPASVKPSFTVAVSDAMGYANNFGGYVQTKSKLNIVVDITTMYGASVASVKVTANGETHNTSSVTTGAIKKSGDNTITVEVIDSRGRKASGNTTVAVLAYSAPAISLLTYNRCDSDGTDNVLGDHAEITFSNKVTSLGGKNAVSYTLEYKTTSASKYTAADMSSFAGLYTVTNGTKIFPADAGSSYDVRLTVADSFGSAVATLVVDTGSAVMHWLPRGVGMAIGKIAEKLQTLELGWKIHMNGNRIEGLGIPVEDQDAVPWKVAKGLHARNLLDNSDFRNPVNQRGQTRYKGAVYGIDRWVCNREGWMVTVEDGHIRISDNPDSTSTAVGMLRQFIPITPDLAGKVVTLAARVKGKDTRINIHDKEKPSGGGYDGISSYTTDDEYHILTATTTVPTDEETFFVALQFRNATSTICEWIALYEGEYTAETLPEYQPKGYASELLECQRYYVSFGDMYFRSSMSESPIHNITISFPVPMRIVPTVSATAIEGEVPSNVNVSKNGIAYSVYGEKYTLSQVTASADL